MKRIIIVGLGIQGRNWVETVQESSEWQIAGIVDSSENVLQEACMTFGIPEDLTFANSEKAFKSIQADAVLVVAPPKLHKNIVEMAVSCNLHVLKEKPFALTLDEAKSLTKLASENKHLILMVNQNYRGRPHPQAIKKAIDEGLLGEIGCIHYECQLPARMYYSKGWRADEGELYLRDMSVHHFDLLRFLTGRECLRVYAYSYRPKWSGSESKTAASAVLTFDEDIEVNYFGSFDPVGYRTPANGNIILVGTRGSIVYRDDHITYVSAEGKTENIPPQDMKFTNNGYSLHKFAMAIDASENPETNFGDNMKTFVITWAAIHSSKLKKQVSVVDFL